MNKPKVTVRAGVRFSRRSVAFLRQGFSLIEMLITLALILVLFVMLNGFASRGHQNREKKACARNLQRIYLALDIYAKEQGGWYPVVPGAASSEIPLSVLVPHYTVASDAFICPGSKDSRLPEATPFADRRISYAYLMGHRATDTNSVLVSDRQIDALPKDQGDQVFSLDGKPPANNHHQYGGNYLFSDGRIESSGPRAPFAIRWPSNIVFLNPRD